MVILLVLLLLFKVFLLIIRAREQPKGIYNDLIWIFRDVIYIEFLRSYNHPLRNEIWDCGIDFSYYLINLCLDATKDIES